jgi:hypothetical protein
MNDGLPQATVALGRLGTGAWASIPAILSRFPVEIVRVGTSFYGGSSGTLCVGRHNVGSSDVLYGVLRDGSCTEKDLRDFASRNWTAVRWALEDELDGRCDGWLPTQDLVSGPGGPNDLEVLCTPLGFHVSSFNAGRENEYWSNASGYNYNYRVAIGAYALRLITGENFGADRGVWQNWWISAQNRHVRD